MRLVDLEAKLVRHEMRGEREVMVEVVTPLNRWRATGTSLHDLSLSPSINLDVGGSKCRWHGFVTAGEAR